jgi:hypothetical protein
MTAPAKLKGNQIVRAESAERKRQVLPRSGAERKRRMSETIARVAEEDRELLLKLAR